MGDRPKLTVKQSLRLPDELHADILAQAARRGVSWNEVVLCALENEFGRLLTYRLNYYTILRQIPDTAGEELCPTKPAVVGHDFPGLKSV